MTVVNPKSISGINSITMASGSDNLLTIHTTNTTERVRVNSDGDVIVGSGITVSPDGDIFATGVTTSTTFVGALTGNVTGNATGLSGTPNISAGTIAGSTGTFTGDVDIADKIVHTGDTDTAIRFSGADTIQFETGGSSRLQINSSGHTVAGGDLFADADLFMIDYLKHTGDTNTSIRFPAADTVTVETAGSERVRIDSSGRVGLGGQTSPSATIHIQDLSANGYELKLGGNAITFNRTSLSYIDQINDTGSLVFRTTSSQTNALTIASNGNITANVGNLVIGTAGKGIDFSATSDASGSSSEILDDYEEGTFTPSLVNGGGSVATDSSMGKYHKIGGVVHVQVAISNVQNHAVVDMNIGNLPFTSSSTSTAVSNVLTNRPALTNGLCCFINDNESQIRIRSAFDSDGQKGSIFNGYGLDFNMTYTVN